MTKGITSKLPVPSFHEVKWPSVPFSLHGHLVMAGRRGSETYGTCVPDPKTGLIHDRDVIAIVIPPPQYYMGLSKWESAVGEQGVWDATVYDLRKFVSLVINQNPNMLEILWSDDQPMVLTTEWATLRDRRFDLRCAKKAYDAFIGYATGQLHKMKIFTSVTEKQTDKGAKRRALIEEFGYDPKNASHLIRLLRMGEEYISTGVLTVNRPDAAELIEIKQGKWSPEKIQREAEAHFNRCIKAFKTTKLPEKVDEAAIEEWLVQAIMDRYN